MHISEDVSSLSMREKLQKIHYKLCRHLVNSHKLTKRFVTTFMTKFVKLNSTIFPINIM